MKLIKIGDNFILANKQEIKLGDVVLEKNTTGYYYMPEMVMPYQLDDNSGIKVIASTNFLDENIHKLDLNNVKKIVYGFEIEKMAEELFPRRNSFSVYESGQRDGFIKGFLKASELNSGKKFTYDEMVMIYNLGREEKSKSQVMGQYYDTHKEFIGYEIKEQSEFDVELEMEEYFMFKDVDDDDAPHRFRPKINNLGFVNILNIKK